MYHGVRDNRMLVSFDGEMRRYINHHVLDFDPTRKRMSIIIEDDQSE